MERAGDSTLAFAEFGLIKSAFVDMLLPRECLLLTPAPLSAEGGGEILVGVSESSPERKGEGEKAS